MKIDAGDKGPDSTFAKGNAFWRSRGRPPAYVDGSALWNACEAYFDPANDNPLYEYKIHAFQGEAAQEPVAYIRAFTLIGLCLHIGISDETSRDWRTSRLDLKETRPKA
ncbi:MAG: terminase small subunit, partial [Pseudomonadota bacterium]